MTTTHPFVYDGVRYVLSPEFTAWEQMRDQRDEALRQRDSARRFAVAYQHDAEIAGAVADDLAARVANATALVDKFLASGDCSCGPAFTCVWHELADRLSGAAS